MPTHLPVFLLTTWLLAMLPGAGQAMMLRQALRGGAALARPAILGVATGVVIWSAGAALGLSSILLADHRAYLIVRLAGGAVLVLIGITTLRSVRTRPPDVGTAAIPERRKSWWGSYTAGLGTNLGNPKAGVFAIAMLPQFVTPQGPVLASTLLLGALWAGTTACWYLVFTYLVGCGRSLISQPAVQRGLAVVTGCVLLGLGAFVASGG